MLLKFLKYKSEGVSEEQYRLWRNHPCTRELNHDLAVAYLDQIESDLPESIDQSIPLMHQREGARKTLDILFNWLPASLRDVELKEVDNE